MAKRYTVKILEVRNPARDGDPMQIRNVGIREVRAESLELARLAVKRLADTLDMTVRLVTKLANEDAFQLLVEPEGQARQNVVPLPGAVWKRPHAGAKRRGT